MEGGDEASSRGRQVEYRVGGDYLGQGQGLQDLQGMPGVARQPGPGLGSAMNEKGSGYRLLRSKLLESYLLEGGSMKPGSGSRDLGMNATVP